MKFSQYKYERSSYENIKEDFTKLVDKINNLNLSHLYKILNNYNLSCNFSS